MPIAIFHLPVFPEPLLVLAQGVPLLLAEIVAQVVPLAFLLISTIVQVLPLPFALPFRPLTQLLVPRGPLIKSKPCTFAVGLHALLLAVVFVLVELESVEQVVGLGPDGKQTLLIQLLPTGEPVAILLPVFLVPDVHCLYFSEVSIDPQVLAQPHFESIVPLPQLDLVRTQTSVLLLAPQLSSPALPDVIIHFTNLVSIVLSFVPESPGFKFFLGGNIKFLGF